MQMPPPPSPPHPSVARRTVGLVRAPASAQRHFARGGAERPRPGTLHPLTARLPRTATPTAGALSPMHGPGHTAVLRRDGAGCVAVSRAETETAHSPRALLPGHWPLHPCVRRNITGTLAVELGLCFRRPYRAKVRRCRGACCPGVSRATQSCLPAQMRPMLLAFTATTCVARGPFTCTPLHALAMPCPATLRLPWPKPPLQLTCHQHPLLARLALSAAPTVWAPTPQRAQRHPAPITHRTHRPQPLQQPPPRMAMAPRPDPQHLHQHQHQRLQRPHPRRTATTSTRSSTRTCS